MVILVLSCLYILYVNIHNHNADNGHCLQLINTLRSLLRHLSVPLSTEFVGTIIHPFLSVMLSLDKSRLIALPLLLSRKLELF